MLYWRLQRHTLGGKRLSYADNCQFLQSYCEGSKLTSPNESRNIGSSEMEMASELSQTGRRTIFGMMVPWKDCATNEDCLQWVTNIGPAHLRLRLWLKVWHGLCQVRSSHLRWETNLDSCSLAYYTYHCAITTTRDGRSGTRIYGYFPKRPNWPARHWIPDMTCIHQTIA